MTEQANAAVYDPPKPDIDLNWELITPDVARELLGKNYQYNRNIRRTVVSQYARDMTHGRFLPNGETIKLDTEGSLLDGQHRLMAVIEAGIPQWMIIVWGIETEVLATIDTGIKRRLRDYLKFAGKSGDAHLASTVNWYARYTAGHIKGGTAQNPSSLEAFDILESNPGLEQSLILWGQKFQRTLKLTPAIAAMTHYVLSGIDREATQAFFERVHTGENLSHGDPALVLRNQLLAEIGNKGSRKQYEYVAWIFKAWNAERASRKVTYLRLATTEGFPVPK